jgi:hypothetical protein
LGPYPDPEIGFITFSVVENLTEASRARQACLLVWTPAFQSALPYVSEEMFHVKHFARRRLLSGSYVSRETLIPALNPARNSGAVSVLRKSHRGCPTKHTEAPVRDEGFRTSGKNAGIFLYALCTPWLPFFPFFDFFDLAVHFSSCSRRQGGSGIPPEGGDGAEGRETTAPR